MGIYTLTYNTWYIPYGAGRDRQKTGSNNSNTQSKTLKGRIHTTTLYVPYVP